MTEEGRVLPYRKMEGELKARGHDVGSYISVRNDYTVLGLATSRASRLRLRAQHRGSQGCLPTYSGGEAELSSSPSY